MTYETEEQRKAARAANTARWRRRHPRRHKASYDLQNKKYHSRPEIKQHRRERELEKQYGITLEYYNALVKKQNGCCAICGGLPSKQGLVVDHNHLTGSVRELLCTRCNTAIGLFKDNVASMLRAVEYIQRHM